jgi:hypothetical protein
VASSRSSYRGDDAIHYRYLLRQWGCKLYDSAGTDWTQKDVFTVFKAVMEGEKSEQEQHNLSKRVLGGKAARAAQGEWQGGPVPLGLDVACYARGTTNELWRVTSQGLHKRLKVYPDGRTERFDGEGNFPAFQPLTEVLKLAPSNDKAKVDAAVGVFKRYARESVSFTALAHWLNKLGWHTGHGGRFQGQHVLRMLADHIYTGIYAWNRQHAGKFHRLKDGQVIPELNYEEKMTRNDPADWTLSAPLFEPLVDAATWSAVQAKLGGRVPRPRAPRSAGAWLTGLLHCGTCKGQMVGGTVRKAKGARKGGRSGGADRYEHYCGTYHRAAREKWATEVRDGVTVRSKTDAQGVRHECACRRNGVFQDELEGYVDRYLAEAGHRLELLLKPDPPGAPTAELEAARDASWLAFEEGVGRLCAYLREHHADAYNEILAEHERTGREEEYEARRHLAQPADARRSASAAACKRLAANPRSRQALERHRSANPPPVKPDELTAACIAAYRANYDPAAVAAELAALRAEHDRLVVGWADLPTERAKERAKLSLASLDARMAQLEHQQADAGTAIERHWATAQGLMLAIADARLAARSQHSDQAMRRRAEVLRGVISRIDCHFVPTGRRGGGWGMKNSHLAGVTIYPVEGGDPVSIVLPPAGAGAAGSAGPAGAASKGTLLYTSAHSFM